MIWLVLFGRGLSHEKLLDSRCRSQKGSWGECTLPSELQANGSLVSRIACIDAETRAPSDDWQPGQEYKTCLLKTERCVPATLLLE